MPIVLVNSSLWALVYLRQVIKSNLTYGESMSTLLFQGTEEDRAFLPRMKSMVGTATVFVNLADISTIAEVIMYCKKRNITGVISTNKILLSKLLAAIGNPKSNPSLDNYAGSYFTNSGIEFVFIHPLEQLVTVPYMPFVTKRFISKFVEPEKWLEVPEFNWEMLNESNYQKVFSKYESAYAIAVDIETLRDPLSIRCIGYTALFVSATGVMTTHSCVLPIDSMFNVAIMRKFNWELKAPKIFQNGKYDISYLSLYNAVPYNYLWDTANLFHCWYCELPKDLAFLGSFFVRKAMYWKDLAETNDLHEYYRYNALDTWTTVNVWVSMLLQMPDWARKNYLLEFPVVFPCHLSEQTGIKRDMERLEAAKKEVDSIIEADNISLSKMLGVYPRIFNVNSAPQNKQFRKIIGCENLNSSDETHLKKMGALHPLNRRLTNKILDIRGNRKLASTYLTTGEDAKEYKGRVLYSINPHATDTGRNASREHHYWCGLQIQNIPQGPSVKSTLMADEGFVIYECDLEQAESRDTAYISGDANLIHAVSGEFDFHSYNASAFFGVPYEEIYDKVSGKVLNKPLRTLAKPVNHGANYLMGWSVLVDTMGEDMVWSAKRLLNLPKSFGLREVAEHLLASFHKTYPGLSSTYYPWVVANAMTTRMFTGATGWTRYTFLNPKENKLHKNALVAHNPQSLNAMVLNQAYIDVFYNIAIHPEHSKNFKLCAQIHDSILFQVRIGHEYLAKDVKQRMERPVTITGCDGVTRTFTVPAAIKGGKDGMGAKYWSETE